MSPSSFGLSHLMQALGRLSPRTLSGRLVALLVGALVLAHALSFVVIMSERRDATTGLMLNFMEQDLATSVALLDRLPAAERADWLGQLERRSYRLVLAPPAPGSAPAGGLPAMLVASIEQALGSHYALRASAVRTPGGPLQVALQLRDGMPLTIELRPRGLPLSSWLVPALLLQLVLLALLCWLSVRLATRPLARLAAAADAFGPALRAAQLPEHGPLEVARAATAFNAMQRRIAAHTAERMQILAAVSHDLQTPITRMRLAVDLLGDDEPTRERLERNLIEMEGMVREGLDYARSMHGTAETPLALSLDDVLGTLGDDYAAAGKPVTVGPRRGLVVRAAPQALRRVLTNVVDNALRYGGSAEVDAQALPDGGIAVTVRDDGPGIPEDQLEAVFAPFHRVEGSRSRDSGGTGLGLAIARQLSEAMGASLSLHNRPEGGLEARLRLSPAAKEAAHGA
ncbi:sensor histidine kinase [Massilia niastensis]|uniref:sensor histidine kinase n=1 Tax=Massilia niastensis TaxID=544911 RepID=UPI001E60F30A|nr:ATP-binding protein [Massilia niastensis]